MRVTDEVVEYRQWISKMWGPKVPPRHNTDFFHPLLVSSMPPVHHQHNNALDNSPLDNNTNTAATIVQRNNDTAIRLRNKEENPAVETTEKGTMEEQHAHDSMKVPSTPVPDNNVVDQSETASVQSLSPEALSSSSDTVSGEIC